LSPLAVGFGVNIQAANHVVHFTRTWNPAKEDQATDRAYRIGQTKEVHVYYPVVVAHDFLTFDAKLDKLLDWKRGLSTDMLNGSGDVSPADFGDLEAPDGGNAFDNELLGAEDIRSMRIAWEQAGVTSPACPSWRRWPWARRPKSPWKMPTTDAAPVTGGTRQSSDWLGVSIVVAELCNQKGVAFDFVDHPMFIRDPARPEAGERVL
jgi:Helicase conserved C-terminal domain